MQCDLSTDYHRQYRKIENPRGRYTSDLDLQMSKSADYKKFIKGRDSFQGHDSLGKYLQYVCVCLNEVIMPNSLMFVEKSSAPVLPTQSASV